MEGGAPVSGATVTIECDCGHSNTYPTAMPEDGTLLHHAALVDTLALLVDASHDCEVSR